MEFSMKLESVFYLTDPPDCYSFVLVKCRAVHLVMLICLKATEDPCYRIIINYLEPKGHIFNSFYCLCKKELQIRINSCSFI